MTRPPILCRAPNPALIARLMPTGIPWTVAQLTGLKPGERLRYYIGRLEEDIARTSVSAHTVHQHDLLAAIRDTADALEKAGRISVRRQPWAFEDKHGFPVRTTQFAYYATGLRRDFG